MISYISCFPLVGVENFFDKLFWQSSWKPEIMGDLWVRLSSLWLGQCVDMNAVGWWKDKDDQEPSIRAHGTRKQIKKEPIAGNREAQKRPIAGSYEASWRPTWKTQCSEETKRQTVWMEGWVAESLVGRRLGTGLGVVWVLGIIVCEAGSLFSNESLKPNFRLPKSGQGRLHKGHTKRLIYTRLKD